MRALSGLLLALALCITLVIPAAQAQVPRGVLAEDATATWCVNCPYAYAGLEVMKSRYDATEFIPVRYYHTSGDLGSPETDARIVDYYGINAVPTVVFDGTTLIVGGTDATATGQIYDPVVATEVARSSPFRITVGSVDLVQPGGSISFDVHVEETVPEIGNVQIRTVILENNVQWGTRTMTDVTRDILPDTPLTVANAGEVQNVSLSFAVDPLWKTQDLWIAVFIQDDDDHSVLQSASTRPAPAYSVRYWTKGSPRVILPSNSAPYEFEDFAVFNWGTEPDVIRASVQPGTMPAGWHCVMTDGAQEYAAFVDLSLDPGESRVFRIRITPGAPGYATPGILLTSANLPGRERTIRYRVISDDVDVLLVDNDWGEPYENYHIDALQSAGATFGVWSRDEAAVTSEVLAHFPVVDWETGTALPTLTAGDRDALGPYLDGGGRLFITGQEIGWEMNDEGGAALAWYRQYLHANYYSDNVGRSTVQGVAGDPISDGMMFSLTGGDGANDSFWPDGVNPRDGYARTILNYAGTPLQSGALKVETSRYKVVYLAFPFESIYNAASRRLLLQRSLDWMAAPIGAGVEDDLPGTAGQSILTVSAFPNPAPGRTTLSYTRQSRGETRIEIFAPDGSLVRCLSRGSEDEGTHTVIWDGRTESGNPAPSGVYFYRLGSTSSAPAGKVIMTR